MATNTKIGDDFLTDEQRSAVATATETVSSANLQTEAEIPFTPFVEPPPPDVTNLGITTPEEQATETEQRAESLEDIIMGTRQQLLGESASRSAEEERQGVAGIMKNVTELQGRSDVLRAEALAIPLQLQEESLGRGRTVGGVAPLQASRLRKNAIASLTVNSHLEASRGNLTTALDLVDRAVSAEFDPIRESLAVQEANLNTLLNSTALSREERNRANRQADSVANQKASIERATAKKKAIGALVVDAYKFGATPEQAQAIQDSKTYEEALSRGGQFLGEAWRAEQFDKQFQRDLNVAKHDLSVANFNENVRQFGANFAQKEYEISLRETQMNIEALEKQAKIEADQKKQDDANAIKREMLQTQLDVFDDIYTVNKDGSITLDSKGFDSRVGPTKVSRRDFALADKFGAGQLFAGQIQQMTGDKTLKALIDVKAQGGTFGALSDGERALLATTATKINAWEVKDENQNGIGEWNIDETSFLKELQILQRLTTTAYERATGIVPLTPEELIELQTLTGQTGDVNLEDFFTD